MSGGRSTSPLVGSQAGAQRAGLPLLIKTRQNNNDSRITEQIETIFFHCIFWNLKKNDFSMGVKDFPATFAARNSKANHWIRFRFLATDKQETFEYFINVKYFSRNESWWPESVGKMDGKRQRERWRLRSNAVSALKINLKIKYTLIIL